MILRADLRIAIALMLVALVVYWGGLYLHTGALFTQSQFPYFTYYRKTWAADETKRGVKR